MNCHECNAPIEPPKQKFCSRKCSGSWRRKNVYGDKYTNKYRALTPRNFMMCLCKKKVDRRDLSIDDLCALYEEQGGLCALSGRTMTYISGQGRVPTNISIDRKDSSVGYDLNNIQLVCIQANKMKAELSHTELVSWCGDILAQNITKRAKK